MLPAPLIVIAGIVAHAPASHADALAATPDFHALASATFTFQPDDPAARVHLDPSAFDEHDVNLGAMQDQPTTLPAESASAESGAVPRNNRFFQRGSWRWNIQLAAATDPGDVTLGIAGVGLSCFLEDSFTVDFELNGLYVNQSDEDADNTAGVNLALLFRWHFWISDDRRWSVYADAGAGILFTGDDVPGGGSSFNFTPQAGVGFSMLLDEARDARLLAGLRWYHISNANTFEDNPGLNTAMLYAGFNFPF